MSLYDTIFNLGYDHWDGATIAVVERLHELSPSQINDEIAISRRSPYIIMEDNQINLSPFQFYEVDSREYIYLLLQLSLVDLNSPGSRSLAELIPSMPFNLDSDLEEEEFQDDEDKNLEFRSSA